MAFDKYKLKNILRITGVVAGAAFVTLSFVAKKKKRDSVYLNNPEQKNPMEGKRVVFVEDDNEDENTDGARGHLEVVGESDYHPAFYDKYVKRALDIALSFGGLAVLSPVFLGFAIAIKIDDPGPVFFIQKRIGQNKQYFKLHKFRTMKVSAPPDVPTHMLDNPDQYVTRVGWFMRQHSIDELPQIWDIFVGNMSIVGPRPGLWNQDVLTAERDKYGANDVKPGLTGWAQINGRDKLEIPDKARLDGEYVKKIGPVMDAKCFLRSVGVLAHDESVVEGGAGEMKKSGRTYTTGKQMVKEIVDVSGKKSQITSLKESIRKTEGKGLSDKEQHTVIPKHILVITQYFYPEVFRINDMCQEWIKRGYKVTVVTGIPNYPMGKFFEGYGFARKRHENWNGIEIIRIPLIPRGSNSIGMAANYTSFMVSGIIAGKIKNIKADLVFSFGLSPMTQVLTGISFAKKLGVPHYLYVQDLWPENVITVTGISNPAVIKPIDKMVDYIYKNTDKIFTTSPSFVDAICNRKVKVDRNKVHYWPQYAEEFYHPCEKKAVPEIGDDGSFKIIFTGNIGTAQGLQILPKTAVLLKKEQVKFVVVGDGRFLDTFNKEVKARGVENKFIMIPRQPAERIPELLAACDVAFVSFQDAELWSMTIPAKLQSYMACGMPIIAAAQGETERIIDEAGCGICSGIGDARKLGQAIKETMKANLTEMGLRSREYFEKNFDKQMLMDQMDEHFR